MPAAFRKLLGFVNKNTYQWQDIVGQELIFILCLLCARHFLKHIAGSNLLSPHDSTECGYYYPCFMDEDIEGGDLMSLAGVTQPGIADMSCSFFFFFLTSHALKHQSSG